MKTCRQCGKEIDMLWPELWAYKAGNPPDYFCSWKCLRANEREDGERMHKLTLENKKKAVEIALQGGSPLNYIRECGVKNATEAWIKIKKNVESTDPETFAKLPKRLPQVKNEMADERAEEKKTKGPYLTRNRKKAEKLAADRPARPAMRDPEEDAPDCTTCKHYGYGKALRNESPCSECIIPGDMRLKMWEPKDPEPVKTAEPDPAPADKLEVAAVYSRAMDSATYKRFDNGMALLGPSINIIKSAAEWIQFSREILVALQQLNAGKDDGQE